MISFGSCSFREPADELAALHFRLMPTNATHDPTRRSWVDSANEPGTDFPVQNLPFCVFSEDDPEAIARGGVVIGDQIVDLAVCAEANLFRGRAADAVFLAADARLNDLMSLEPETLSLLRSELSDMLSGDGTRHRGIPLPDSLLVPLSP